MPVVVVSVDLFNSGPAGLVIVMPIIPVDRGIPLHVRIPKGEVGTKQNSVIVCEALRAIAKDRLVTPCGELSPAIMAQVEDRLSVLLDL
jgi:mRNA interferase MazF